MPVVVIGVAAHHTAVIVGWPVASSAVALKTPCGWLFPPVLAAILVVRAVVPAQPDQAARASLAVGVVQRLRQAQGGIGVFVRVGFVVDAGRKVEVGNTICVRRLVLARFVIIVLRDQADIFW